MRSIINRHSFYLLFVISSTANWRPRRESNSHLRFRKPLFYPLNYGDKKRFFLVVSPVCVTLALRWRKRAVVITGNRGSRKLDRTFIVIQSVGIICSSKGAASSFAAA